jgi:hypothetical protein
MGILIRAEMQHCIEDAGRDAGIEDGWTRNIWLFPVCNRQRIKILLCAERLSSNAWARI